MEARPPGGAGRDLDGDRRSARAPSPGRPRYVRIAPFVGSGTRAFGAAIGCPRRTGAVDGDDHIVGNPVEPSAGTVARAMSEQVAGSEFMVVSTQCRCP